MSKKLKNKVAVITGGNSGIGLATAKKFVEEGAYVYITGRRQSELDKAKAAIGNNVTVVQGDVSNLADLDRLITQIKTEKGKLDIVVANAGVVAMMPTEAVTEEHYDKIFEINAKGAFFTVQKAIPILNNDASIILVSSGAWQKGIAVYPTYSATKATLRSFVRTWAADLAGRNIRANTVSPGPIDTPIFETQFKTKEEIEGAKEMSKNMVPLGRLGKAEEIANAILFLASKDSSFITGSDLPVDGGLTQI